MSRQVVGLRLASFVKSSPTVAKSARACYNRKNDDERGGNLPCCWRSTSEIPTYLWGCLTKQGNCRFLTTESAAKFSDAASVFLNHPVEVEQIRLVE